VNSQPSSLACAPQTYGYEGAALYNTLGITGTTYEVGYEGARALLGDINGMSFLDFGSGTGRSAEFLSGLGARHVYGIDHDPGMVALSQTKAIPGCEFMVGDGAVPLPDSHVDGALSVNAFVEFRTHDEMRAVCLEVARVLRSGGTFVVMSISPQAFGRSFRSFSYLSPAAGSGSTALCRIVTPKGPLDLDDTYWEEADYIGALESAGLAVDEIAYPLAPQHWDTSEREVAPFILLRARKPSLPAPLGQV
jgi:SAM-dependent methyltransferase